MSISPNAADKLAEKRRYRTPSVYQSIEVSLSDFDEDEICEYLRHKGYVVCEDPAESALSTDGDLILEAAFLARLEMLIVCGQGKHAAADLLAFVGNAMGRKF